MAGNKVYVGDLADNVEEEEIKQAFQKIGEVTEVELKSNFAFVHMADSNDVDEAIKALHETLVLPYFLFTFLQMLKYVA